MRRAESGVWALQNNISAEIWGRQEETPRKRRLSFPTRGKAGTMQMAVPISLPVFRDSSRYFQDPTALLEWAWDLVSGLRSEHHKFPLECCSGGVLAVLSAGPVRSCLARDQSPTHRGRSFWCNWRFSFTSPERNRKTVSTEDLTGQTRHLVNLFF